MSAERTEELSEPRVSRNLPVSVSVSVSDAERKGTETANNDAASNGTRDEAPHSEAPDTRKTTAGSDAAHNTEHGSPTSEVSRSKIRMQGSLPALDDDADVGVQKEHIVTRDGKADLRFNGVLLASAAPASAPLPRCSSTSAIIISARSTCTPKIKPRNIKNLF